MDDVEWWILWLVDVYYGCWVHLVSCCCAVAMWFCQLLRPRSRSTRALDLLYGIRRLPKQARMHGKAHYIGIALPNTIDSRGLYAYTRRVSAPGQVKRGRTELLVTQKL